jgi:hypothetical protein
MYVHICSHVTYIYSHTLTYTHIYSHILAYTQLKTELLKEDSQNNTISEESIQLGLTKVPITYI